MENTSKLPQLSERDIFYYRQRAKNRLFEAITSFFAEEAERKGISKKDIAECLRRDPAQITRWLTSPSNLTSDTVSDLLLSLGAEMDHHVARFQDRGISNETHPLIQQITQPSNVVKLNIIKNPEAPKRPYTRLAPAFSNSAATTIVSDANG